MVESSRTPGARFPKLDAMGWLCLASHTVGTLAIFVFCRFVVLRYYAYFDENDIRLPPPTIWVLRYGQMLGQAPVALIALLLADTALIIFLQKIAPRDRLPLIVWWVVYMIAVFLLLAFCFLALQMPMLQNQDELSQ